MGHSLAQPLNMCLLLLLQITYLYQTHPPKWPPQRICLCWNVCKCRSSCQISCSNSDCLVPPVVYTCTTNRLWLTWQTTIYLFSNLCWHPATNTIPFNYIIWQQQCSAWLSSKITNFYRTESCLTKKGGRISPGVLMKTDINLVLLNIQIFLSDSRG